MTLATYRQEAFAHLKQAGHAERMAALAFTTDASRHKFAALANAHRAQASKIFRIIARNQPAPFIQIEG